MLRIKKISEILSTGLKNRTISAEEIAEKVGISKPYVYELARESKKNPSEPVLKAIESLLGIQNAEDEQGKFFLGEAKVEDLKEMAGAVLKSGHEKFARALAENIRAYHYASFSERPGAREEYSRQLESKKDPGG